MLRLVTGVPGSSKTLNTIKRLLSDKDYKDRQIYYAGIDLNKDLPEFDRWIEIEYEQFKDWESFDTGSIIVIDEAQRIMPQRPASRECPEFIHNLSTHRHLGLDFIFVTQHASMLDAQVRKMFNEHVHYERKYGSEKFVTEFIWQETKDPKNYHDRKEAQRSQKPIDSEIFKYYKSAEVHTHKSKIPWKFYAACASVVCIFTIIGYAFYNVYGFAEKYAFDDEPEEKPVQQIARNEAVVQSGVITNLVSDPMTPRVVGEPWTAPIYDHVRPVVTYPKPSCVHEPATGRCKCYSQQSTLLEVSVPRCINIVYSGNFDYSIPDDGSTPSSGNQRTNSRRNEARDAPGAPAAFGF